MTHKDIQEFFNRKPAIKITFFFREAELTMNDWYNLQSGKKELSDEQKAKVQEVMFRYGG